MTALHKSRELAEIATERLKVFSQPQRLMILSLLLEREHTVGEIEEATGVGQPAQSAAGRTSACWSGDGQPCRQASILQTGG